MNPSKVLTSTRTTRTVGVGFSMKVSVDHELTINSNKNIIRIKINTSSIASKQIYIIMRLFMQLYEVGILLLLVAHFRFENA